MSGTGGPNDVVSALSAIVQQLSALLQKVALVSISTPPGGANGSVQYNNAGAFGGLTDVQLTAKIQVFTAALSGAATASGGGTTNFLRADGSWAAPPAAGAASGDLSGTYPGPTVAKVNGVAYPSGPSTNTVPVVTGANTVTYEIVPVAAGGSGVASLTVSSQSTPSNPTGTSDTGGKMMGLAGAITPAVRSKVLITISGTIFNATAIADGGKVQIRYGTGAAPANGDALTGTAAGGLVQYIAATTAEKAPFSLNAVISGLTPTTAYWIDVGLAAITGGTATINDVSVSAVEIT